MKELSTILLELTEISMELTEISMELAASSFEEFWKNEDDEYWESYLGAENKGKSN